MTALKDIGNEASYEPMRDVLVKALVKP